MADATPTTEMPVVHPVDAPLRNEAADRWRRIGASHALHAVDRRSRDPIGPHVLAFHYQEPDGALRTATRLLLAGTEADDLVPLLHRLTRLVTGHGHGYDPRTLMANRVEPMSPEATWAGLAISSLDTPTGRWTNFAANVWSHLEVPVRGYVRLTDGSRMLLDLTDGINFAIRSSRTLNIAGNQSRIWRYEPLLADDPTTSPIWAAIDHLHDTIRQLHP